MVVPSIFVQIASYHDYELPRTILNCINNSSGLTHINIGVHNIYYEKDDTTIEIIKESYNSSLKNNYSTRSVKINNISSKAPKNIGVGIARNIANSLYDGEDYYLQIDSHMKFEKGWDLNLINDYLLYKENGCNPVITAYPASYHYDNKKTIYQNNPDVTRINFSKDVDELFLKNKIPNQEAVSFEDNGIFIKSISAASVFSEGSIASIVPNKKIFFWGEEILMAARFFTHGYDLMVPSFQNLFHLYLDSNKDLEHNLRRSVFNDFKEESIALDNISKQEVYDIFTNNTIGEEALGNVRTLKDFEFYSGLDFSSGEIK
jgi:hypothetical protein